MTLRSPGLLTTRPAPLSGRGALTATARKLVRKIGAGRCRRSGWYPDFHGSHAPDCHRIVTGLSS